MGLPPGFTPVSLVRQSQAQILNRKCSKFCRLRPPVGPEGIAPEHSWFCAPEIQCRAKGIIPVMGVRGPTPPVRGRCREATEGVGWRSYGHEVPVGRRRRNYPAYYEPDLKPAPSSAPVCALGHLPPRGKALVGNCPPHPALRATFPPGGRLTGGQRPPLQKPPPTGHP